VILPIYKGKDDPMECGSYRGINSNNNIIIQHLYSALKSCKRYGGAGGSGLRLSEQVCFEVFLKVCKV